MPDSPGLEALFVRLYLDRHIMGRLAVDLRGRGYDVVRTEEAGKDTAPDDGTARPRHARKAAPSMRATRAPLTRVPSAPPCEPGGRRIDYELRRVVRYPRSA